MLQERMMRKIVDSARLLIIREMMGLSSHQLASLLGVDHRSVIRWENGMFEVPDYADRKYKELTEEFEGSAVNLAKEARALGYVPVPHDKKARYGFPASWYRAVARRAVEISGLPAVWDDALTK